jgi:uncharacterized membrane protein YciS (DUF1049 family)
MTRRRSRPRLPWLEFEHRGEPLLPMAEFRARLLRGFLLGAGLIVGSLVIGVCGYHWLAGLPWVDSILNASMILAGMGPVDPLSTAVAKLFASGYALFSGVMFLTSVGVLVSPIVHRFLHRFHLETDSESRS